jgi:hypothetical protein
MVPEPAGAEYDAELHRAQLMNLSGRELEWECDAARVLSANDEGRSELKRVLETLAERQQEKLLSGIPSERREQTFFRELLVKNAKVRDSAFPVRAYLAEVLKIRANHDLSAPLPELNPMVCSAEPVEQNGTTCSVATRLELDIKLVDPCAVHAMKVVKGHAIEADQARRRGDTSTNARLSAVEQDALRCLLLEGEAVMQTCPFLADTRARLAEMVKGKDDPALAVNEEAFQWQAEAKQLKAMGFSLEQAQTMLTLTEGNVAAAVGLLL